MKRKTKYLLIAMVLAIGIGLNGCAKVWEKEWVEIELCPKIDIEPGAPEWDDQDSNNNNGAGNEEILD